MPACILWFQCCTVPASPLHTVALCWGSVSNVAIRCPYMWWVFCEHGAALSSMNSCVQRSFGRGAWAGDGRLEMNHQSMLAPDNTGPLLRWACFKLLSALQARNRRCMLVCHEVFATCRMSPGCMTACELFAEPIPVPIAMLEGCSLHD